LPAAVAAAVVAAWLDAWRAVRVWTSEPKTKVRAEPMKPATMASRSLALGSAREM